MFTRQHHKAIAEIVKQADQLAVTDQTDSTWIVNHIATRLADYFAQDNPQFDRSRFLDACGL